jgi:exosortase A
MAILSQSSDDAPALRSFRSAWIVAGASLAVVAVALVGLFRSESEGAFRVWLGSTAYNHCFLVLPVAAYLAWTRREALRASAPQPDLRALFLLVPLGLLWMVAALMSVLELRQFVLMAMFQAIALAILGWRAYRAMLVPFLYLFFLVPTGYFLVPWLQQWTAAFAVSCLRLIGIPVYSDGVFIEVPSGNFVVAEACAGLRFLVASVAFGVFFAALVYRSRVRWFVFIVMSIVVPIIANGIRAFGIIALSELTGSAAAVEADHIIYGWGFFTAVTLLLIVIGLRFADDHSPGPPRRPRPAPPAGAPRSWSAVFAGILGLMIAAAGPAYAQFRDWRAGNGPLVGVMGEPSAGPWRIASNIPFDWKPVIHDADRDYVQVYSNGRADVLLYVALYKDAGLHNNLVRGTNDIADGKRWTLGASGALTASIGGIESPVATSTIMGRGGRLLVWHFYVVQGRIAASPLRAKLLQLRQLFLPRTGVDAFVAVAADEASGNAPDTLEAFLADFTPRGSPR